jgi:hypothetical protein
MQTEHLGFDGSDPDLLQIRLRRLSVQLSQVRPVYPWRSVGVEIWSFLRDPTGLYRINIALNAEFFHPLHDGKQLVIFTLFTPEHVNDFETQGVKSLAREG